MVLVMIEKQTQNNQKCVLSNVIGCNVRSAVYLKSGIKLVGRIICHDQFTILLKDNISQLIYKHAVATVVPFKEKD
jgi:host factor-I protein